MLTIEEARSQQKFFAKYALVPPILVLKFDLKNPEQIAKYFDVSAEAAGYAWEYYQKWSSRETGFTDYEIRMKSLALGMTKLD